MEKRTAQTPKRNDGVSGIAGSKGRPSEKAQDKDSARVRNGSGARPKTKDVEEKSSNSGVKSVCALTTRTNVGDSPKADDKSEVLVVKHKETSGGGSGTSDSKARGRGIPQTDKSKTQNKTVSKGCQPVTKEVQDTCDKIKVNIVLANEITESPSEDKESNTVPSDKEINSAAQKGTDTVPVVYSEIESSKKEGCKFFTEELGKIVSSKKAGRTLSTEASIIVAAEVGGISLDANDNKDKVTNVEDSTENITTKEAKTKSVAEDENDFTGKAGDVERIKDGHTCFREAKLEKSGSEVAIKGTDSGITADRGRKALTLKDAKVTISSVGSAVVVKEGENTKHTDESSDSASTEKKSSPGKDVCVQSSIVSGELVGALERGSNASFEDDKSTFSHKEGHALCKELVYNPVTTSKSEQTSSAGMDKADFPLKWNCPGDEPKFLCWMPSSQHSLAVSDEDYVEHDLISRTVHFDDYEQNIKEETFVSHPVRNEHCTSMSNGMMGLWFVVPKDGHNWYGNVSFNVKLQRIEWLLARKKYRVYLLEVVEYEDRSATRLLVASECDPEVPSDLMIVDNKIRGGPWYKDEFNRDYFLTSIRDFQNSEFSQSHEVEFFFRVSVEDRRKLFMCTNITAAEHAKVNTIFPLRCYKHRSGFKRHWVICPYDMSARVMQGYLKADVMLEAVHLLQSENTADALASEMSDVVKQCDLQSESIQGGLIDLLVEFAMEALGEKKKNYLEQKRKRILKSELASMKERGRDMKMQEEETGSRDEASGSQLSDEEHLETEKVQDEVASLMKNTGEKVEWYIESKVKDGFRSKLKEDLPEVLSNFERRLARRLSTSVKKAIKETDEKLLAEIRDRKKAMKERSEVIFQDNLFS